MEVKGNRRKQKNVPFIPESWGWVRKTVVTRI
jgi:hypothetical protein